MPTKKVLIIGASGSGKSCSLRNLNEKETAVIKCINKELPFKKGDVKFKSMVCNRAEDVVKTIGAILQKAPHIKNIVIDDLVYLSVSSFMNRSKEKGFEKFTDLANELYSVLTLPETVNRDDITFIYLTHSETNPTTMETNVRTIGKVISEKVVPEGLFTVVLEATILDGEYKFLTHNITGSSVVKSPMGMFEEDYIDNDMTLVLNAIKEYY